MTNPLPSNAGRAGFPRREGAALTLIIAFALCTRLLFCVAVVGLHAPLRGDEIDYHGLAASLASSKGFVAGDGTPTAARPPLYPMILASVYALFGARPDVARLVQVLLGTGVVPLVWLLGRRVFSPKAGLVAAAIAACDPLLVFMSSYVLTESLYTLLLLCLLVATSRCFERGTCGAARLALGGALLALASLARPNAFPLALFLLGAWLFVGRERVGRRLSKALLSLAILLVVLAPWGARNERRLGSPVLFTTHGGMTFYQGNNRVVSDEPSYRGGVAPLEALPGWDTLKCVPEVRRNREAWRLGLAFLRENKAAVPALEVRKFTRFWRLQAESGLSGVRSGWWWGTGSFLGGLASSVDVVLFFSVILMPLFVLGVILSARRWRALIGLYGVVVVHTLVALVFFGSLRSRAPVEPVIALFASAAVIYLVDKRGRTVLE